MLTLDLPPEVETRLVEEAARRGLPVSEVVALLAQGINHYKRIRSGFCMNNGEVNFN